MFIKNKIKRLLIKNSFNGQINTDSERKDSDYRQEELFL